MARPPPCPDRVAGGILAEGFEDPSDPHRPIAVETGQIKPSIPWWMSYNPAYAAVLSEQLWPHFRDDSTIEAYWKLPHHQRRKLWTSQLDMAGALREFNDNLAKYS